MSYTNHHTEARDNYAFLHSEKGIEWKRLIVLSEQANTTEEERRKLVAQAGHVRDAYNADKAKKKECESQAEQEMEKALDEMDEGLPECTMTPEQLTQHIQKTVPSYHFDCSEENLKKQKELHEKAKAALHRRAIQQFRDDPYSRMSHKVWGTHRSNNDYGPYVGRFMSADDKEELENLTRMVEEGEKTDPDFKENNADFQERRNALHRKICLDAILKSDEMFQKYSNMTTEEQIENYDEIYIFSRLGDTTNAIAPNLTPEERTMYHKKMNRFLSIEGYVSHKVCLLGTQLGDRIDAEQFMAMDKKQIKTIKGSDEEPPYLKVTGNLFQVKIDPMAEALAGVGSLREQFAETLGERYSQFAISDDQYADAKFDRKVIYKTPDGKSLSTDEAFEEMIFWHRPVLAFSGSHPEAEPVPVFIDQGKHYFGGEVTKAFESCDLGPEEPVFHPTKELTRWQKIKRGLANFLESIPLLNINGNTFRDEDIKKYDKELEAFQGPKQAYKEQHQNTRKMRKSHVNWDDPEYLEGLRKEEVANQKAKAEAEEKAKSKKEKEEAEKEKAAEDARRERAEKKAKEAKEEQERLTVEAALQSSGYSEAQAKGFTHLIELVDRRALANQRDNIEKGQAEKNESYIRTGAALKKYYDELTGILQETRGKILENAELQKTNPNVSLKVELPERVQEFLKDLPDNTKDKKKKKGPDVISNRLKGETDKIEAEVDAIYYKEKEEKRKAEIHEARRAANEANEELSNDDLFALAMMQANISNSSLPARTQTKLNVLHRELIKARLECKRDVENMLADKGQLTPEERRHYAAVAMVSQRMEELLKTDVDAITNGSKEGLSPELSELIGEGKEYSPEEFAESVKNALFNKAYDLSKSNEIETLVPTTEELMRMVAPEDGKEATNRQTPVTNEQEVTTAKEKQFSIDDEEAYWNMVEHDEDDYEKEEEKESEKEKEWKEEKRKAKMIEEANDAAENLQPMVQEASKFKEAYRKEAGFMERKGANMYNRMDHIAMKGLKIYQDAYSIINSIRNGDQSPDAPIPSEPLYMVALYEVTRQLHQAGDYTLENMMDNGLGSNGLCKAMRAVPQINDAFKDMTAEKFVNLVNKPDFMKFDDELIGKIKVSAMTTQKTMERNGTLKPVTQKPEKNEMTQDQQTMYTKNTKSAGMSNN